MGEGLAYQMRDGAEHLGALLQLLGTFPLT